MSDWMIAIAVVSLVTTVVGTAVAIVWRLSRSELNMRADHATEITAIKTQLASETADLAAKIYKIEIYVRDEFVRNGPFEASIARMEKGFGDLKNELAVRLDKMSDQIQHINQRS